MSVRRAGGRAASANAALANPAVAAFAAGVVAVAIAPGCSAFERGELPPHGEALVVVDTDLPVPRVVSRLRVDLYEPDGTWFASRDDVRPDPRDWPTSFSVVDDDDSRERVVLVRLRAYLEGRLVRYRGIVYASPGDLLRALPDGDGQPRLLSDGADATPELEPDPTVTVDRIVRVRLVPGTRGRVSVVLRGACAGALPLRLSYEDQV